MFPRKRPARLRQAESGGRFFTPARFLFVWFAYPRRECRDHRNLFAHDRYLPCIVMGAIANRSGRVFGVDMLNPPIDDCNFRGSEALHVWWYGRSHALQFAFAHDPDRALALQLGSDGHDSLWNRAVFLSDVRRASNRLSRERKRLRIREPQNLVEFCGAEPVALAGLPNNVMDKPFELVTVENHLAL